MIINEEHKLALFRSDFGRIIHADPAAVCEPMSITELQSVINYAAEHQLPLTVRANGLSQSGQSLAVPGGLVLSMQHINHVQEPEQDSIWVEANSTWSDLLDCSLPRALAPYVVPHNCNLSIGGVLSAGGIGAASFKHASVINNVNGLEILQANGELAQVEASSSLMQACLGGQGRFGLITKARIALRPCGKLVRTFFLTYADKDTWLQDLRQCQQHADYIESFCTPAIQGAKLSAKGRLPFAQWLYALHVSIEYDNKAPDFHDLDLTPWKVLATQDESIHSYLHRHDSRFNAMKLTGQWELPHPWYECFIQQSQLANLEALLTTLPVHYASVVHIAPIANPAATGFLMLPEGDEIFALMILNPGLPAALIPSCLETIRNLDATFLAQGGKRYLSGFLGESLEQNYWKNHFGARYAQWMELKKIYDPQNIFCSMLHPS